MGMLHIQEKDKFNNIKKLYTNEGEMEQEGQQLLIATLKMWRAG